MNAVFMRGFLDELEKIAARGSTPLGVLMDVIHDKSRARSALREARKKHQHRMKEVSVNEMFTQRGRGTYGRKKLRNLLRGLKQGRRDVKAKQRDYTRFKNVKYKYHQQPASQLHAMLTKKGAQGETIAGIKQPKESFERFIGQTSGLDKTKSTGFKR